MTFKIHKPALAPARGTSFKDPVEKLNMATQLLLRTAGDPMQSAVRLGELFDAGLLRYDASGLLVPGPAVGGSADDALTFKNYIINGDHRWWQRGTVAGTLVSTRLLSDRFVFASNGNALSSNRQTFDLGQTAVPGSPIFFQRVSIDSVSGISNAYSVYFQRIENLRRFAGKTVTFSWYAKALAPREMSLELILSYGSGGSASDSVNAPTKYALTTEWKRFSQTVTIPSMVGKVHNMADSFMIAHFWLAAGPDASYQLRSAGLGNTAGIIDIACIQMEDGDHATDFEFLPDPISLAMCQRYFEKSYNIETALGAITSVGISHTFATGLASNTHLAGSVVGFAVRKRAVPALTLYSPETGTAGKGRSYTHAADVDVAVTAYENGFRWNSVTATAAASDYNLGVQWVADAEL